MGHPLGVRHLLIGPGWAVGFELARLDLELRWEGDVLGAVQSGRRSGLKLLSLLRDEDLVGLAPLRLAAAMAKSAPRLV